MRPFLEVPVKVQEVFPGDVGALNCTGNRNRPDPDVSPAQFTESPPFSRPNSRGFGRTPWSDYNLNVGFRTLGAAFWGKQKKSAQFEYFFGGSIVHWQETQKP